MKTVAIIQARMSSTRLPGKVLLPIIRKPMLWYVVTRIKKANLVDEVIVATSEDASDDQIFSYCQIQQFPVFRGELEDVLSRYYHAAQKSRANIIARITSDCPLIDGELVDQGIAEFHRKNVDYLSNTITRTYPRGFDFEVFTFSALEKAFKNGTDVPEREHVTPYIWKTHSRNFRIQQLVQEIDKSNYRLTVDVPEDFEVISKLVEKYQAHTKNYREIIEILDSHPELARLNQQIEQKQYGH